LESVALQYQVGPNTSPIFQKIGKKIGASPMMLEHMYKGYTGSMGMYLVDLMDAVGGVNDNSPKAAKRFEQMPVIKRFAIDPEARGTVTSYYELKKEVDETVRTFNFLERTGKGQELGEYTRENARMLMSRDTISVMDKQMDEINEMTSFVRNSQMSPEAKRTTLTALTRAANALTAHVQNIRKAVE
jgi:tetrahydromethanopterin S-methyltransferase subunit G